MTDRLFVSGIAALAVALAGATTVFADAYVPPPTPVKVHIYTPEPINLHNDVHAWGSRTGAIPDRSSPASSGRAASGPFGAERALSIFECARMSGRRGPVNAAGFPNDDVEAECRQTALAMVASSTREPNYDGAAFSVLARICDARWGDADACLPVAEAMVQRHDGAISAFNPMGPGECKTAAHACEWRDGSPDRYCRVAALLRAAHGCEFDAKLAAFLDGLPPPSPSETASAPGTGPASPSPAAPVAAVAAAQPATSPAAAPVAAVASAQPATPPTPPAPEKPTRGDCDDFVTGSWGGFAVLPFELPATDGKHVRLSIGYLLGPAAFAFVVSPLVHENDPRLASASTITFRLRDGTTFTAPTEPTPKDRAAWDAHLKLPAATLATVGPLREVLVEQIEVASPAGALRIRPGDADRAQLQRRVACALSVPSLASRLPASQ